MDIGDDVPEDNAAVAKARLRSDSRKWLLSKALPKVYGDRIAAEITGKDGGPIEVEGGNLELARRIAYVLRDGAEQQQDNLLLTID